MRPPIRLLGSVEVEVGGQPGKLGPARQRAVLAVLLLAAGHPVQGDELLSRVWGFDSPPAARQALRTYVCRLRQAVRGSGLQVDRASGGYVAVVDPERLDLSRFRRLVADARAAGRAGNSDGALAGLTEALGLWPGSALAGVHSPWLADVRTALAEERLCVELDHNELALQRGQHAQLLPTLTAHVAQEPFDERLTGQLMLALQASGRASDALAAYERMRRRLRDELGTEPARALREVHQQVLRAEDGPGSQSAGTRPRRPVPHQLPPALVGFVNRRFEWRALDLALTGADDGTSPRLAVLTGTGGVGKTTLAVRWAREPRRFRMGSCLSICRDSTRGGSRWRPSPPCTPSCWRSVPTRQRSPAI